MSSNTPDREQMLKAAWRDFPDCPKHFVELALDFCLNESERAERIVTGQEEIGPGKDRSNPFLSDEEKLNLLAA